MIKYFVNFEEVSYEDAIKETFYYKRLILNEFESKTETFYLGAISFLHYITLFDESLFERLITEHISNYDNIEFSIKKYENQNEGEYEVSEVYFYDATGSFKSKKKNYLLNDIQVKEVYFRDFNEKEIIAITKYLWKDDDIIKAFEYHSDGKFLFVEDFLNESGYNRLHYEFSETENYYKNGLL